MWVRDVILKIIFGSSDIKKNFFVQMRCKKTLIVKKLKC